MNLSKKKSLLTKIDGFNLTNEKHLTLLIGLIENNPNKCFNFFGKLTHYQRWEVRQAAVNKLDTDGRVDILIRIVLNASDELTCLPVLWKFIENHVDLLAWLIQKISVSEICEEMVKNLLNDSHGEILTKIAKNHWSSSVRTTAIKKLNRNQYTELFIWVAENDPQASVRREAVIKLGGEYHKGLDYYEYEEEPKKDECIQLFARIAENDCDGGVRWEALNKILNIYEDKVLFARIAENDSDDCVRWLAMFKLNSCEHGDLLVQIAKNDKDMDNRIGAIKKIDVDVYEYAEALTRILQNSGFKEIREEILNKFDVKKHVEFLTQISKKSFDYEIQKKAREMLKPRTYINS